MITTTYLTVTTIVTAHTTSEITPSTLSRVAGTPWAEPMHSWIV